PHPRGVALLPYTTLFRSVRATAQGPPVGALAEDDAEDAEAVPHGSQIAGAVDAEVLVAGYLLHLQARLDDPDVHQGLDLEPGAVDRKSTRLNSSHVKISY